MEVMAWVVTADGREILCTVNHVSENPYYAALPFIDEIVSIFYKVPTKFAILPEKDDKPLQKPHWHELQNQHSKRRKY